MTQEIPAYQPIDIILSGGKCLELEKPQKGYVVTFPDSKIDTVMLLEREATPEKLAQLKSLSKWPDSVFFRKAWLHEEQVVYGEISKRKYWTIR